LTSSASSSARSWADKVKGTEASHTTVSVEVLPRTGACNEDGMYHINTGFTVTNAFT
jgi:hypothetical protein